MDLIIGKLAEGITYEEPIAECEVTREDILAVLDYIVDLMIHLIQYIK